MAEALIRGALGAGLFAPEEIVASDIDHGRRSFLSDALHIAATAENREAVAGAEFVLLAVKPQVMPLALRDIGSLLTSEQLVISIAAGISTAAIEAGIQAPVPVVRVMPNTPALIGAGASALCRGTHASEDHLSQARSIFEAVGRAVVVEEKLMDAVTGLSGSGPAYIYILIEALSDGGVKAGLPRAIATDLAAQTVLGAARMVLESGKHPGQLKDMVASPGGTTIAGIAAMESRAFRSALIEAVEAAARRSQELGRENK